MSDDFDDLISERLRSAVPKENNSQARLLTARPAMTRARRLRQVQTGVASLVVVVGLGTSAVVTLNSGDGDGRTTIADAPEQPTTSPTSDVTLSSQPSPSTAVGPTPSSPEPPATTVPRTAPASSAQTDPDPPPTQTPTTAQPGTTRSGALGPGSHTIQSDCGSITIEIVGNTVSLLDVQPQPGFAQELDDESSQKVGVEFEGGTGHCELKVEPKNDGFFFTVSNESPNS
jgi:hypothetical protein